MDMALPTLSAQRWLGAILREPLTHFLLAGLAMFLFFAWRGNAVDPASRTIIVDEAQVERLAAIWTQTWQRPPRGVEIDGMIRDYIKEEIYNREAIRLGLDQDDIVIRRRLRSKMEYLEGAAVENSIPSDATLQKWLDSHAAQYASDARFSFDQIYLGEGGLADARRRADAIRGDLTSGRAWNRLGERISLPISMETAATSEIDRQFGDKFTAELARIKPGTWSGPVASGFGYHLVRVRQIAPGKAVRLSDVRQSVENDWRAATLKDRQARAYQALLDGYSIRIAKP